MPDVKPVRFELRDSDAPWLKATFVGEGRLPTQPPNPAYPNGIALDPAGAAKACGMALQHPAPQVGKWLIDCETCRQVIVVTAAGRPDDPCSIRIPCKPKEWRDG